jgi:hypothetical protein
LVAAHSLGFFLGSLKVGVVSGRLAFKNVRYINEDYCIVVYDGYIWFSYWLSYRKKQLSGMATRNDGSIVASLD